MRTSLQRPSNGSSSSMNDNDKFIPHQGSLSRVDDGDRAYVIEILVKLHNHDADDAASSNSGGVSYHHELAYTRRDFMFSQRLFQILDTESRGFVDREIVKEFVLLRCPVFWRRDEDLKNFIGLKEEQNRSNSKICTHSLSTSPTFDEIWTSVAACSSNGSIRHNITSVTTLGVEGWMVFCRFVALAQYLEAKRRFSARHLQQTMRQRNAPRGSELVMVNVPPMEQPAELSPVQLANHEKRSKAALPLPELDLDHVLVAAHDALRSRPLGTRLGSVKICLFGSSSAGASTFSSAPTASAIESLEFAVTYTKHLGQVSSSLVSSQLEEVVARRSMQDLQWLHATFDSHKVLGGTLCGRILPRFHTEESSSSTSQALVHFQRDLEDSRFSVRSTGGAISAVATASVGKLRDAALSFRSYMSTGYAANNNGLDDARSSGKLATSTRRHTKAFGMVRSCLPESYYNPNSPEGRMRHLERYLNYLLEHPALSTSFPLNTILKSSQSGLEAAKEMLVLCDKSRHEMNDQAPHLEDGQASNSSSNSGMVTNFAWVRTAAQAAMALHVHGMLETTGLSSASARLQHASLPLLSRVGNWDEEERRNISVVSVTESRGEEKRVDFEEGVISVMSELQSDPCSVTAEDDYDLLPLPLPAPERRILSEGSDLGVASVNSRESRFHYGNRSPSASFQREGDYGEYRSGVLSDMAVDDNIDKLREVIGSVDNTLSRCLASCGSIGKADRDRQYLHLDVVRSLDSFAGMRGKFVSQRSLMKGVAGIEQSGALYEEAYISMIDDLSWQTSLSRSAVSAAEDVRSSVRASRVAANAKAAASSAALSAHSACESGAFNSIEEARAAQTRSSIAQSHAIHAAVVEHEAKTVKRRATLALANDVKVWNIHRKREMLLSSIVYARSQHEATRRAVDAWSSLRDGFVGSTMIPIIPTDRRTVVSSCSRRLSGLSFAEHCEVTATIYEAEATIVATEHPLLSSSTVPVADADETNDKEASIDFENQSEQLILPFAMASPVFDAGDDRNVVTRSSPHGSSSLKSSSGCADYSLSPGDGMSASMQSLVDGLMTWGGGLEFEEDHFALPLGMAASIVMEGSMMG